MKKNKRVTKRAKAQANNANTMSREHNAVAAAFKGVLTLLQDCQAEIMAGAPPLNAVAAVGGILAGCLRELGVTVNVEYREAPVSVVGSDDVN